MSKDNNSSKADKASNSIVSDISPVLVGISDLHTHPKIKNREIDKEHVANLSLSIGRDGLDVPLAVYGGETKDATMKVGDDEVPARYLIAGHHRLAAIKKLEKEDAEKFGKLFPKRQVPVRLYYGALKDAIILQLRENLARKEPEPAQLFEHLLTLKNDEGMKSVIIAKRIGRSEAWVSRMLSAAEELGDEGVQAIKDGDVTVSDAVEAAEDVKREKKSGGKPDAKAALKKIKDKKAATKAKGKQRSDKRVSAKSLHARYKALPKINTGRRVQILEETFAYIVGESDDLPAEMEKEVADKKPSKKAESEE